MLLTNSSQGIVDSKIKKWENGKKNDKENKNIRLHVACALLSSDNELKMTRSREQIDLIKLLSSVARKRRAAGSSGQSLALSFLSGDPRLPDIAGIQTRFSRRGQIDYGFDARGLCVCLGPVCFEKYRLGLAVTKLFFSTHALGKHLDCLAQFIDSIYSCLHKECRNLTEAVEISFSVHLHTGLSLFVFVYSLIYAMKKGVSEIHEPKTVTKLTVSALFN